MPNRSSSKKHHCPGQSAGNNLPGNCRDGYQSPRLKRGYCGAHQKYCTKKGHDEQIHLKTEKCPQCETELELAAAEKAKKDAEAAAKKRKDAEAKKKKDDEKDAERERKARAERTKRAAAKN